MTNIAVPVPPSLAAYRGPLRDFFAGMIGKLARNSHKDTPKVQHIEDIIGLLRGELEEFEDQLNTDKFDENALVELQDAANYAFLAFLALRLDGVKTARERMISEFMRIDPEAGKVFCKKTRAGGQYRVGDEIKGSTNKEGYVYIKLQSRASNIPGITLPRSHLIWWGAKGVWPMGLIDHDNRVKSDDRISNLRDASFSDNNFNTSRSDARLLPRYVTQYLPTGRSHLKHYGKFVYQRHHQGMNIRCCYYDTPEEASVRGALAWAERVKSAGAESPIVKGDLYYVGTRIEGTELRAALGGAETSSLPVDG